MGKKGRRNKYDSDVKPRFEEIKDWIESGATDKEVAANLGIAYGTLYEYKNRYPEFNELCKNARKAPVRAIKAALYKRATGFSYSEKKEILEDGVIVREERYTKAALPDPASAMILLKHWAKDEGWTNDPQQLELRKQELELKKKQIEEGMW